MKIIIIIQINADHSFNKNIKKKILINIAKHIKMYVKIYLNFIILQYLWFRSNHSWA